jgi:predicted ABC-type ATPase
MTLDAAYIADSLLFQHHSPADVQQALQYHDELVEVFTNQSPSRLLFIHMMGVPGSGKSTMAKAVHERLLLHKLYPCVIGNDLVLERLPCYQLDRQTDQAAAFKRWEMPSRIMGYYLVQAALDKRLPMLYDSSGHDPRHLQMLQYIQSLGYKVAMVYAKVELATAQSRVAARVSQPGARFTPPQMVAERYAQTLDMAERYRDLLGNHFFEVDNNGLLDAAMLDKIVARILN